MKNNYLLNNKCFEEATKFQYITRSMFKLAFLNKKYNLIKRNDNILDLGAAPGSWLQYTKKIIANENILVGIDQIPIHLISKKNMFFLKHNVLNLKISQLYKKIEKHPFNFDIIVSDVLTNTTGIKIIDAHNNYILSNSIFKYSALLLKKDGICVTKILSNQYKNLIVQKYKKMFNKIIIEKSSISRKTSNEIYIIGYQKKSILFL